MELKLEVVVLPVSDVDRAKAFYEKQLGFRLDVDYVGDDGYRVVHLTPPGSGCSVVIGNGVTSATPGAVHGLHLIVGDIEAARAELAGRGVDISEMFHDAGGRLPITQGPRGESPAHTRNTAATAPLLRSATRRVTAGRSRR